MKRILLSLASFTAPLMVWHSRRKEDRQTFIPNKYHCVSIKPSGYACEAVENIAGKRFLSDEAPAFPLPGCNAKLCKCRYVHYDDRRHKQRRANDRGYLEHNHIDDECVADFSCCYPDLFTESLERRMKSHRLLLERIGRLEEQ